MIDAKMNDGVHFLYFKNGLNIENFNEVLIKNIQSTLYYSLHVIYSEKARSNASYNRIYFKRLPPDFPYLQKLILSKILSTYLSLDYL